MYAHQQQNVRICRGQGQASQGWRETWPRKGQAASANPASRRRSVRTVTRRVISTPLVHFGSSACGLTGFSAFASTEVYQAVAWCPALLGNAPFA
jgi:hypothetical protein